VGWTAYANVSRTKQFGYQKTLPFRIRPSSKGNLFPPCRCCSPSCTYLRFTAKGMYLCARSRMITSCKYRPLIADYFILAKAFLRVIISSIGYASNGGDYRQLAGSKLCQPDHQRFCIDRGEHHIHHSCMHCCGLEILHPPTDHQELRPG